MRGKEIYEYAKKLRLTYISTHIEEELKKADMLSLSPEEFLTQLLQQEYMGRSERSKLKRIRNAAFPYKKYLSDYELERMPKEAKKYFAEIKTLDFIGNGQNIVAYGNPGTGKTHLSIALGIEAANAGYSVKFFSVPVLINQLKELKLHRNLLSIQRLFESTDLIILDELGYITFDREGGELLFTHLSMRTERKSTIITTNLSFDKWKSIFHDAVITTAIVDRLADHSFILNMIGESNRRKK